MFNIIWMKVRRVTRYPDYLNQEFYIFRNVITENAAEAFYKDALFEWPVANFAMSNLAPLSPEDSVGWVCNNFIRYFLAFIFWELFNVLITRNNLPKASILRASLASSPRPPGQGYKKSGLELLRWVTLGHHYDWTNKVYPADKPADAFPSNVAAFFEAVARSVATLLRQLPQNPPDVAKLTAETAVAGLLSSVSAFENFRSEAAIVNYYRKKTTMGFHVDNAEFSETAPLISIR